MHVEAQGSEGFGLDRRQLLQAGAIGGTLIHLLRAVPARADQALDVQVLQTAASIENAAVSAYDTILALPLITAPTANATVRSILTATRAHHSDHAVAYNDIAGKLGGKNQVGANSALAQVTTRERPRLTELGPVLDLALQMETTAVQTYQNNLAILGDLNARKLSASILGVAAQHAAVLQLMRSLVTARTPDLIALDSGTAGRLPEEVGRVSSPEAFAKVDQARPPAEGAVA